MLYANTSERAKKTRALHKKIAGLIDDNNKLAAEVAHRETIIANLRDDAQHRQAQLDRAQATIEEQAKSIAAFKEEMLAAQVQIAEMRGYVSRALEDDAVREAGATEETKPVPDAPPYPVANTMPSVYVPGLRRKGPATMQAPYLVVDYGGRTYDDPLGQRSRNWEMRSALDRLAPKHWTQR